MDTLSHALWAAATGKGVNLKSPKKIKLGWMALWGVLPDLFAFTPVVLWMLWQLYYNGVAFSDIPRPELMSLEQRNEVFILRLSETLYHIRQIFVVFLIFFFLPLESSRFSNSIYEALALTRWYAREHVLLCLVPAFFIAGAIAVFVSQAAVMKYLGAGANKVLSYGVASVSGSVLAVCSCTVLPLFAGIWQRGAGLGPAVAFLYSGPAVNVLAIILTARILGPEIGLARAIGAIVFSIVIGLFMHLIYRKEEKAKAESAMHLPEPEVELSLIHI